MIYFLIFKIILKYYPLKTYESLNVIRLREAYGGQGTYETKNGFLLKSCRNDGRWGGEWIPAKDMPE
jgi:hypothetical protein